MHRAKVAACAFALAACFSLAKAQSLPSAEAFGDLPLVSQPALSPDQAKLIKFEGEDHYLELAVTRFQVLKEMERFLNQHRQLRPWE